MFHFLGLIDFINNMVALSGYILAIFLGIELIGVNVQLTKNFRYKWLIKNHHFKKARNSPPATVCQLIDFSWNAGVSVNQAKFPRNNWDMYNLFLKWRLNFNKWFNIHTQIFDWTILKFRRKKLSKLGCTYSSCNCIDGLTDIFLS